MEKGTGVLHGHFNFKTSPDGKLDKSRVICKYCRAEMSYHRSNSSLKYHLKSKHAIDASRAAGVKSEGRLTTRLDSACGRNIDEQKQDDLLNAISRWLATSCRPVSIVEDAGLRDFMKAVTKDSTCELPSRHAVTERIHELYEKERAIKETALHLAPAVALTGDYWPSVDDHNYLNVTVHYIDAQWRLQSHALAVMNTGETHFAETHAEDFINVALQWNISHKVSTLGTDSARNMMAVATHLPFVHVPCVAHSLQRSITVSLQDSVFANVLDKCRKVVDHFKHSPTNPAELQQQQPEHGQMKESLVRDVPTRWNSTLDMVKSVLRNERPLRHALAPQTEVVMLTTADMDKLQRLQTLLEPCRYTVVCFFHFPVCNKDKCMCVKVP